MNARERLVALAAIDWPGALAPVPVEDLRELLATGDEPATSAPEDTPAARGYFVTSELEVHWRRKGSAVRALVADRAHFPNAYRFCGREWRVPVADVEAFERTQAEAPTASRAAAAPREPTSSRRRALRAVRSTGDPLAVHRNLSPARRP